MMSFCRLIWNIYILHLFMQEMAENELREFRRSLCFKARPLPDFYHKTEPIKESNRKVTPNVVEIDNFQ